MLRDRTAHLDRALITRSADAEPGAIRREAETRSERRDDAGGPRARFVPVVADDHAGPQRGEELGGGGEVGHLDECRPDRIGDVGVAARAGGQSELGRELARPAD